MKRGRKRSNVLLIFLVIGIGNGIYAQSDSIPTKDTIIGLQEVVVKAGLTQSQKSMTAAFTKLRITGSTDPLQQFWNIPGLQSNQSILGGSTLIQIRGPKTLDGNSSPLITFGGQKVGFTSFYDQQQNKGSEGYDIGTIIPFSSEDISTITVASDAGSVLYGNEASKGRINFQPKEILSGIHVEYTITGTMTKPYGFWDMQKKYGGGYGIDTLSNGTLYINPLWDNSWNNTPYDPNVNILDSYGDIVPYQYPKKDHTSYYRNGYGLRHYLGISYGTESFGIKLSYARKDNQLIIPNGSSTNDVLFGQIRGKLGKLQIKAYGSLGFNTTNGRSGSGYSLTNPTSTMVQYGQGQVDFGKLKNYQNQYGTQLGWNYVSINDTTTAYNDNPYWAAYKNAPQDKQNNSFLSFSAKYPISEAINIELSGSRTEQNFKLFSQRAIGSVGLPFYSIQKQGGISNNLELVSTIKKQFGVYEFNGFLGTEVNTNHRTSSLQKTQGGLIENNVYTLDNSIDPIYAERYQQKKLVTSWFAGTTIGYNKIVYLDMNIRGDKSSALPKGKDSYVYYGTGLAWIASEMIQKKWLTLAKLRTNISLTGIDPDPYLFTQSSQQIGTFQNTALIKISDVLGNPNIKPEIRTTYEIGADISLWDRIQTSLTYYISQSKDHIVPMVVDPASGYTRMIENIAGMRTKGWEIGLNGIVFDTKNWRIESGATWSTYTNKVTDFTHGTDRHIIGSDPLGVQIGYQKGMDGPQIFGTDYETVNGKPLIDAYGGYVPTSNIVPLGKINPDWTGSWNVKVSYKNYFLTGVITHSQGGNIYSETYRLMTYNGRTLETATDDLRQNGTILDGVVEDGTGEYIANTIVIDAPTYGKQNYTIDRRNIFSATNTRLAYLGFGTQINRLTFEIYGQNLLVWNLAKTGLDPQNAIINTSTFQGIENGSLPISAIYGFKVGYKF